MLKEAIKKVDEAQAFRQCQWRNVIFSNDGQTVYGAGLFPSAEEARAAHEDNLQAILSGKPYRGASGKRITKDNYSFCMQIPVMGT